MIGTVRETAEGQRWEQQVEGTTKSATREGINGTAREVTGKTTKEAMKETTRLTIE